MTLTPQTIYHVSDGNVPELNLESNMSKAKGIPYNPPTRGKMKMPAAVGSRTKRNFANGKKR